MFPEYTDVFVPVILMIFFKSSSVNPSVAFVDDDDVKPSVACSFIYKMYSYGVEKK